MDVRRTNKSYQKEENKKEESMKKLEKQEDEAQDQNGDSLFNAELLEEMSAKESKISRILSDLTIKKIIIVVLLIMFLVPLFDSDNYIDKAESWDFTVKNIHQLLKKSN